jgi:hypothetical protein
LHANRKAAINLRLLRQIGDVLGADAIQQDLPRFNRQQAGNRLNQRAFARAIWAHHRG